MTTKFAMMLGSARNERAHRPVSKRYPQQKLGLHGPQSDLRSMRVYRLPTDAEDADSDWQLETDRTPVLVIEDKAADAFACERALAGSPYQALSARSLAQAKRALAGFTPSAILLALVLVGEEAWRFLIELKQARLPTAFPSSSRRARRRERRGASAPLSAYGGVGMRRIFAKGLNPPVIAHQAAWRSLS